MKPLSKPFLVAGVQHVKLPPTFTVTPTSKVLITHNPLNPYDPFALEVRIDDTFVGHIPRTEQAAWFYFNSQDIAVVCRLIWFDRNLPPYEQIKVVFECSDMCIVVVVKQRTVT